MRTYYDAVGKFQEYEQAECARHSLRQCRVHGLQALGRCGCRKLPIWLLELTGDEGNALARLMHAAGCMKRIFGVMRIALNFDGTRV